MCLDIERQCASVGIAALNVEGCWGMTICRICNYLEAFLEDVSKYDLSYFLLFIIIFLD